MPLRALERAKFGVLRFVRAQTRSYRLGAQAVKDFLRTLIFALCVSTGCWCTTYLTIIRPLEQVNAAQRAKITALQEEIVKRDMERIER